MTQRTNLAECRLSILASLAAAILFSACSSSDSEPDEPQSFSNSLLLNYTGNYESGELRWMNPDSAKLSAGAIPFAQDSRVSAGGGNIFVLSNYPGVLSCILPEEIGDASAIKQSALDAQAPYDAAVIGGKGYIALNDEDYVQVFNVSACAPSGKIELPAANAVSIKASGDTLLVVLQRRDGIKVPNPGLLVRINATTKALIDTMQLKLYNPSSSVLSNGKLYVSSQKYSEDGSMSIDLPKSGVEVVNLANGTSEVLATGAQLGGGANSIALDEKNRTLYVSVYADRGDAPVKPLNLDTKAVGSALPGIKDSFGGLVFGDAEKKLFVGDVHQSAPGLKIYDPASKATIAVNQGANALPPYSLAIARW